MPDEIRLDAAGKLGKLERTPQGGARIPASLTRAGVLEYRQPDGSMRREWRPSSEVFREDAIASLDSLPAIIGHSAWVTPSNYSSVTKGVVDSSSAKRRGNYVDGRVTINDADTLRRCDSSGPDALTDLSLGYSMRYTPGAGVVPEGEPDAGKRYDGVQSNLVANHVALLPPGTARAEVGFRFDSQDDPLSGAPVFFSELPAPAPAPTQETPMALLIRLDSKEHDVATPAGALELQAACDKIRQDAREATEKAQRYEGVIEGHKTTIARLETEAKDTTRLDSLVTKRVELETTARTLIGDKFDGKGKTNREIMVEVIRLDSKDYTGLEADGKTPKADASIEGRFDAVVEHAVPSGSIHAVRSVINPNLPNEGRRQDRNDGPRMSASERARIANDEASRNAWRTPRS